LFYCSEQASLKKLLNTSLNCYSGSAKTICVSDTADSVARELVEAGLVDGKDLIISKTNRSILLNQVAVDNFAVLITLCS
jgi:Oxidative-stress-responsive kinase 1 C-terminal domain